MRFKDYIRIVFKKNNFLNQLNIIKHIRIYLELRQQLNSGLAPLRLHLPWITIEAKNTLLKYFKAKKHIKLNVFEYGSGGSSLFFLKNNCNVYTIEHDNNWLIKTMNEVDKENLSSFWHPELIEPEKLTHDHKLVEANPKHYFSQDSNFTNHTFISYASSIDVYPEQFFDIIMIDGRARPSCIMHASTKLKSGGLLIIDNSERDYYFTNTQKYLLPYSKVLSAYGALVASNLPTQTNIYLKK
jgi:hypothetical protein